nr:MAG TPA: hypothetical protein [Caudoviricetes sp.]
MTCVLFRGYVGQCRFESGHVNKHNPDANWIGFCLANCSANAFAPGVSPPLRATESCGNRGCGVGSRSTRDNGRWQ